MVTQAPLSEQARSTLLSQCEALRGLTEWLDGIDRRPGLDELDARLSSLEVKAGTCFLANLLGETLVQQKAGFSHPG